MDGDEEVCWWPATRVARAIADRALSASEYLEALLARVERYNHSLNIVVRIDERATAAAAAADRAIVRGESLGPLHGVAMTVKDCFATAGLATTAGSRELASYVPDSDAAAIRALRQAGAIVYGKTNMPEYGEDVQTHNVLWGTTRNPWDPGYTAGGSSGGSAGAVASGFSAIEIGSDVAGSIRIPASHCGVYGHKPSFGTVPLHGIVPPYPRAKAGLSLAVAGPLGRSAGDLELLLAVIAGPEPADRPAWRIALPPPRDGHRLAVWSTDEHCPVDREIVAAMRSTADRLSTAGYEVTEDHPGIEFSASDEVFRRLLAGLAAGYYSLQDVRDIESGQRSPRAELGADFVAQSYIEWKKANDRRQMFQVIWAEFFTRYDAILLPVTPNCVAPHDHRDLADRQIIVDGQKRPYWDQLSWVGLAGVAHLPATVMPIGRDRHGLPIGMCIAGPYLDDLTTLRFAREFAEHIPPLGRPAYLARCQD